MEDTCDFVIIGGGQAGIPLAKDLVAAGKQMCPAKAEFIGQLSPNDAAQRQCSEENRDVHRQSTTTHPIR